MSESTVSLTKLVRIYPNSTMRKFINKNIRYRIDMWNKGINQWESDYRYCQKHIASITFKPVKNGKKVVGVKRINHYIRPAPSGYTVRNELVKQKKNADRLYAGTIMSDAMDDLQASYKAFFDKSRPDAKKPKRKIINGPLSEGSYSDSQARTQGKYLLLTASRSDAKHKYYSKVRMAEKVSDGKDNIRRRIRILKKDKKYFAAVPVEVPIKQLIPTGQVDGVDVNVGHFNSAGVVLNILPSSLNRSYEKIKHYQRMLAHKREVNGRKAARTTKNYQKISYKLRRAYEHATNIQHDIVQKYTHYLFTTRDRITIEDLDVKHLMMSHVASKGMHRSLFGYFRNVCEYKAKKFGKQLVIAHRLYGSTQECPRCHYVKINDDKITLKGNKKHGTNHNEYVCYNCGYEASRDDSAYQSLAVYDSEANYQWYQEIKVAEKAVSENK